MSDRQKYNVRVTPEAWANLIAMAKALGYKKGRGYHGKGVSKYLEALATKPMADTRPSNIKQADLVRLKFGKLPMWHREFPRFSRAVILAPEAVSALMVEADRFAISDHTNLTAILSTNARLSVVVEALGLGWLSPNVPLQELSIIKPPKRRRRIRKETDAYL